MYLLLITNKSSNIMEDLDTLRILAKIVPEFCPILEEDQVQENAFELVFAFDEVLANGYRDNVTLSQVKTSLEMESYEEKVHRAWTLHLFFIRYWSHTRLSILLTDF